MWSSEVYEYTALGSHVVAFTTKRTLGRDRQRLCQMLNIDDSRLIIPHQVHADRVKVVDKTLMALGDRQRRERLEGIDAVVTDLRNVCIGVSTADCIPVLVCDNEHRAVAAIHAGWRGTVSRIVEKTLHVMNERYGSQPAKLRAVIGPGISVRNFEVGDEVYRSFQDAGFDMKSIAERQDKWHIDLWEANRQILTECGVKADSIHVERICTYDSTDSLFSARAEQKGTEKCGRNFNAIMLI